MAEKRLSQASLRPAPGPDIDRRGFIVSGAFALTVFAGARWLVATAEAAPADAGAFRTLSAFLTGAPNLDAEIAARAFGQLTELDASFPEKAGALAFTVFENQTRRRVGSLSLMSIRPEHGVAEVGFVW